MARKIFRKLKLRAILDGMRSSHNVGSVFRTAEGLGFEKIYLSRICPIPGETSAGRKIAKTALGAEKFVNWETKQAWRAIEDLKKKNFFVLALENGRSDSISIFDLKIPKKFSGAALVVGQEVKGLSEEITKRCHKTIHIPMFGKKESFNASVAFGMAGLHLVFLAQKFSSAFLKNHKGL